MVVICVVCKKRVGKKIGIGVSHGYCKKHGLMTLMKEGLIEPHEAHEFSRIMAKEGIK